MKRFTKSITNSLKDIFEYKCIIQTFLFCFLGYYVSSPLVKESEWCYRAKDMSDLSRIAGVIYPDVLQVDNLVSSMLEMMHPGIKGEKSLHTSKNAELGIIGSSIAFNETRTSFAVLDGVIENLPELRRDLKSAGIFTHLPEPQDVLLAAYTQWNERFIEKVDGAFALAIVNTEKQELFLARDRIGKKPLYWYQTKSHLIFGSELKALLATGLVPQTPSSDALAMYLYFGYIPQDLSPIEGINKLLPSHYLHYRLGKGKAIRPYWSYSTFFLKESREKPKEILANLSALLQTSTRNLIPPNDKPLGCFVTGGLGSSTVAWEVTRQTEKGRTEGFSVGFKNETEDDVSTAEIVAKTLNIKEKSTLVTPKNLMDDLVSIVWNLGEPLADPNIVATWKLSELAAKSTSTIFSGMGSDEFLAGHNRYTTVEQAISLISRLNLIPSPLIKHLLIPAAKLIYPKAAFNILKIARTNPWQFEYMRHSALFNEADIKVAAPKLSSYFDPDVFLHKFHNLSRITSSVASYLYLDVKTRLPDHYMFQYERITKAHGLSWRTPFLSRELIEYTASLPEPNILSQDETASYLKPLISPIFPESVVKRPKKSRPHFLQSWAEHPEINALFHFLEEGTLVKTGIISESWIKNELKDHGKGNNNFQNLFSLLVLEVWFRLYINHPIRPEPPTTNLNELLAKS